MWLASLGPAAKPNAPPTACRRHRAGTALSFEGRSGTGGQLGHGNDFDYWSPFHVEWLQLTETNWSKQQQEGGGELAWKVQQVGMGCLLSEVVAVGTDSLAAMHHRGSGLPTIRHPCLPGLLLQVSCGLNHTAAIIELAPGVTC